ncbi:hypothetical protein ATEIFO6365_0002058600 [Aspergillus terreus]|uniref:Uncharacterized protein n=1 Tax=Aspergillus terreus TaxID=33178 RepID=A0A5M3YYR3_ASPTE|nr:hypothetical protein ATETN484_0004058600 [Aspergillus terreus]GFF13475.1 hypothetical protein ATEIFO6365_0002058600 [Aspergillus terreus]
MSFSRTHLLRASALRPARTTTRRPTQQFARRTYASASHGVQASSNLPWMIGSATLLGPGLYYLLQNRPQKQAHHASHDDHGPPKEAHAPAGESAPQPDRDAEQKVTSPQQPQQQGEEESSKDVPENPGRTTMEVDRGRSDNPYVNEPGKSEKGEGETETVKVKGSVSPERPQA